MERFFKMIRIRKLNGIVSQTLISSKKIHCTASAWKRRGPTFDVDLPELIADKAPTYYPTIEQKLNTINYHENINHSINIGLSNESEDYRNFLEASLSVADLNKNSQNEDIVNDDALSSNLEEINAQYSSISNLYEFTEQYLNDVTKLANHYGVYRDLFPNKNVQLPKSEDLIRLNAVQQLKHKEKLPDESFFFPPLVPICAEFLSEDSEGSNSEEIISHRSYRGNLIPAECGRNPPKVTLHASAIHGKFDLTKVGEETKNQIVLSSPSKEGEFYTLALINLDSHFDGAGVCHWMVANIHNSSGATNYDTLTKYLPVYGIRGLGYHRYVFTLFRHKKKLDNSDLVTDFDLGKRKFDAWEFLNQNKNAELTPVGLSWFQTTWSESCKEVYHKFLGKTNSSCLFCSNHPSFSQI